MPVCPPSSAATEPLARLTAAYRAVAGRRAAWRRLGRAGAGHRRGRHRQDRAADPVRRPTSPPRAARWCGAPAGTATRRRPGGRGPRRCAALLDRQRRPARRRPGPSWRRSCRSWPPSRRRDRRRRRRPGRASSTRPGGSCAGPPPRAPVVVILDDLQWADESTVDLLRFLARQPQPGALLLVGAYRPDEPPPGIAAGAGRAGHRRRTGAAARAVRRRGRRPGAGRRRRGRRRSAGRRLVHERSGGHPFFARELCHLLADRRCGRPTCRRPSARSSAAAWPGCPPGCAALLEAAAVAGATLLPDVLAEVDRRRPARGRRR